MPRVIYRHVESQAWQTVAAGMHSVALRLHRRVLPYLDVPSLGPITAFGVLAILGVYFGGAAVTSHAARLGLPTGLDRMRKRRQSVSSCR